MVKIMVVKKLEKGWADTRVIEMPIEEAAQFQKERAELGTSVLDVAVGTVVYWDCTGTLEEKEAISKLNGIPLRDGDRVYDPATGAWVVDQDAHLPYI